MNDLTQRLAALSPEQKALLKRRLKQKQNPSFQSWVISKRETSKQNKCIVSFEQQGMWFQDQLGVNSAISNNVGISLKITGNLQVKVLEKSLREIFQRHEPLRTNFQIIDGNLTQIITPLENWHLPIIDLQTLPLTQQEKEIHQIAKAQACQPFNLESDRLLKPTLLQCNATQWILLLIFHHIAMDAWSLGVFFRELSQLYAAFSQGELSPLAPLPIQYADFAVWQRKHLQGEVLDGDLAYWRQKLANAPELSTIKSDRPRPSVQSFNGQKCSFLIPKTLTESLKTLSQQNEATLYMTLLAALQTLLFRYTRQEDVLIGSPVANRHQPEVENLIGCFINTIVLRTDLSGNPSFRTLLERVRETVLGALAHQTLPLEQLILEFELGQSLTYAPFFQVLLVLQNAFSSKMIELPGLIVEHDRIDHQASELDLAFYLVEEDKGIIGKLEYNTDLFDEVTVTRLIEHFQTLLTAIVNDPDQAIATIPLLTPAEQAQLSKWQQTPINSPQTPCIHQLFEAQVKKTPDAIAVVVENEKLTYQELNRQSNQLAHYLQTLGVKSETLVGICLEPSIRMIIGLLGILKAGGAYILLDPSDSDQFLKDILADAQVTALLTQQSLITKLPKITAPTVYLDTDWQKIALENENNLDTDVNAQNLAYVAYTADAKGNPIGIMIEHQSLVNFTEVSIDEYKISQGDRILQLAYLKGDGIATEIFPALGQGATLKLLTKSLPVADFLQICHDWQITILNLPTAFWHQMIKIMVAENLIVPDSMRLVMLSGEKVGIKPFKLWQQRVKPHVCLINRYGTIETSFLATTIDLSQLHPSLLARNELPIGKSVRNVQIYLLDEALQPSPIGIVGELYIGGIGVARGYLNKPDLTAKNFIPNPFNPFSEERLYKTGDRARYTRDGTIEWLGRDDHHLKLDGYRLEFAEIEAVLTQHPQIQETVIIAHQNTPNDKQLIAYVVPVADDVPTPYHLHHFLKQRLPKAMIPAGYVCLNAFPLNKRGKIERYCFPKPESSNFELTPAFIPPRTATEKLIAEMFAQILNLKQVGIEDDFFELGGNFWLATQLIDQLLAIFPVKLTIVDLFELPTIAGLAQRIKNLE